MIETETIFDLIHKDHLELSNLISDVEKAPSPNKTLVKLTEKIRNHGEVIELVIYPRLARIMKRNNVGQIARQEQSILNECAGLLCAKALRGRNWNTDLVELKLRLHKHVTEQEQKLFTQMKILFDRNELEEIRIEYRNVKNGFFKQVA